MDDLEQIVLFLGGRPFKGDAKEIGWQVQWKTAGVQSSVERIDPLEASRRLRELANHIDVKTEPFPPDHNMALALQMACHLVPNGPLPPSIGAMTPDQSADLVELVDKEPLSHLPVSGDDFEPFTRGGFFLCQPCSDSVEQ
jgi:hypothetical protein